MADRFKLDAFVQSAFAAPECLVCSGSFEQRCLTIPRAVRGESVKSALVLRNVDNEPYVGASARQLAELFPGRADVFDVFGSDPLRTADGLGDIVARIASVTSGFVLVDISAMMRETLLILLGLLHAKEVDLRRVVFAYNAAGYNRSRPAGERPWLSYGTVEVRSVLGYPGAYDPTAKRHLILVLGFEVSRAEGVLSAKDPSIISLGIGSQAHSTSAENAQLNEEFAKELEGRHAGMVRRFEAFPDDAEMTAGAILAQASAFPEYKPIVCAMNTKVSTCGAAIAAWRNKSIEIVYAEPALYNYADYSVPSDDVYVFTIPQG